MSFESWNCSHFLINEKDHADVWKYMNEIRWHSLVQATNPLVPEGLTNTIRCTWIYWMLILHTSSNDLIWVCSDGCKQFRQACKEKIFTGSLYKEKHINGLHFHQITSFALYLIYSKMFLKYIMSLTSFVSTGWFFHLTLYY